MKEKHAYNILCTILFLLLINPLKVTASDQFYACKLDGNTIEHSIKLYDASNVEYGKVDRDFIELSAFESGTDGFLEFNIQLVEEVEVFVYPESNLTDWSGFKFNGDGKFDIYANGILKQISFSIDDFYAFTDLFRIQMCGGKLSFYKNDVLLFSECNIISGTAYRHRTKVYLANQANIHLSFKTEMPDCLDNFSSDNPTNSLSKQKGDKVGSSHQLVIVSVYELDGQFVKQHRVRLNNEGKIPKQNVVLEYDKSKYLIKID